MNDFEKDWQHTWEYHLIGTGIPLRAILLAQCSQELLDSLHTTFLAMNASTTDAYVLVSLRVHHQHFDLHHQGYRGHPHQWLLSGRNAQQKCYRLYVPDSELCHYLEQIVADVETIGYWEPPLQTLPLARRREG